MKQFMLPFSSLDILFKDFHQQMKDFESLFDDYGKISKVTYNYPIDIYFDEKNNLFFEIPFVGVSDIKQINITTEGDRLRVFFSRNLDSSENKAEPLKLQYLHKGISKRDVAFCWKLSEQFCLEKLEATFKNGLLTIKVPTVTEKNTTIKNITIKEE